MASIYDRIAQARKTLAQAGIAAPDAAIDADVLARHALGWDRARLLANGREAMPPGFDARFTALVDRRATREPVAMITGHKEFWGLDFEVSRDVLVPRPETELIIEEVRARRAGDRVHHIVDVGTGSGCLAIALATEYPRSRVTGVDISAAALAMARRNAARHRVAERVRFVRGDLLEPFAMQVDVIVANPPYVPAGVALSPDITRFEPSVALYSGDDGLLALDRLIASARGKLARGGLFVVEFGFGQDDRVADLANAAGWSEVDFRSDLQGIPRVAILSH